MDHSINLITILAVGFGLALILGVAVCRLKLPPLVGYLLAGIVMGPATPGFVADAGLAAQLAEIGVMLLMFGVGLHFSLDDLLSVRRIALPGAVVQIVVATLMGWGATQLWGWSPGEGLVFGLALSVASTVVLLKALEARGGVESTNGRIAVGWLIVEDLAMVLVLVLLPPLSGWLGGVEDSRGNLWLTLAWTLGQVGIFVALMLVVGRRLFPWILWQVAKTGSRELFTLCVVAAAVGIAWGSSEVFGVSFALGAFFAGMVMRESDLSYRAAEESLPLRDAFSVLFFVSVGMLFDPAILWQEPLQVLAVVAIIIIGKSLAAFVIVLAFRYPLNTALTVSASLAQIGEFSFILAGLGVSLKLLPEAAQSLIVAGALISIALNPFVFRLIEPIQRLLREKPDRARLMQRSLDPLAELPTSTPHEQLEGQVVLVGYGRVGRPIAAALAERGVHVVVVEQTREAVEELRRQGRPAVAGDPSQPGVLIQAHIARARVLVIAIPETFAVRQMAEIARALNPDIHILVRSHSEDEAAALRRDNTGEIFIGEQELAKNMTRHVLEHMAR